MTRKLVICTPLYDWMDAAYVSWGYHSAYCHLLKSPLVDMLDGRCLVKIDLVRARSRAVRMFLERDATDLLFWDEDVVPRDINVINAMLGCDKDIVGVPYPRKRVNWDKLSDQIRDETEQAIDGRQSAAELEGAALTWPLRASEAKVVDGMAKVSEIGMGFTLIRRHVLEKMVAAYRDLEFLDVMEERGYPTVALFQLMIHEGKLLSEDYSFCQRWRDLGGEIHVIVDPAAHVGRYAYGSSIR